MQRVQPVGQPLNGRLDAPRLIDADLLGDGQVHGQVQKGIGAPLLDRVNGRDGGVYVREIRMVFRMLDDPICRLGL